MRVLLTTDLHNTPRPEHSYRLQYLEWLLTVVRDQQVSELIICGDLTDAKDNHPGSLLNAITSRLYALAQVAHVHLLYGNHDGPGPERAYWEFLNCIPGIKYYTTFHIAHLGTRADRFDVPVTALMVPWGAENRLLEYIASTPNVEPTLIFMHATVNKAVVENGTTLDSELPSRFLPESWKTVRVFSGDIHVPQICGDVQYIGTPYHIHYGDSFVPRTLVWDSEADALGEGRFPNAPELWAYRVSKLDGCYFDDIPVGTRVKLIASLDHEILPQDWQTFVLEARQRLEGRGVHLASALLERKHLKHTPSAPSTRRSDEAIVRTYGENQKLDAEMIDTGIALTKESP